MDDLDKIFWLRIGFAILAGLIVTNLSLLPNWNAINGIWLGFLFYIISYITARALYGRKILPTDKSKLATIGIGAYVFMFLFIWILYYTIRFI